MSITSIALGVLKAFTVVWALITVIVDGVLIHKAKAAIRHADRDIGSAKAILWANKGTTDTMLELGQTEVYFNILQQLLVAAVIVLVAVLIVALVFAVSAVPSVMRPRFLPISGFASIIIYSVLLLQISVPIIVLSVLHSKRSRPYCRSDGYCSIAGATVALGWVLTVLVLANLVIFLVNGGDGFNMGGFPSISRWWSFSTGRILISDHEDQAKPLLPEDFELPKSPAEPEVIFEEKDDTAAVVAHEVQATLLYPG